MLQGLMMKKVSLCIGTMNSITKDKKLPKWDEMFKTLKMKNIQTLFPLIILIEEIVITLFTKLLEENAYIMYHP